MRTIIVGDVDPDEQAHLDRWEEAHPGYRLVRHCGALSVAAIAAAAPVDAACILGTVMTPAHCDALTRAGGRVISTRSIGYDSIDRDAWREGGLRVAHVEYSPGAVAEFTLMLMLMALRRYPLMAARFGAQDFVPQGMAGRELADLTVGIIGAGRIGGRVAALLAGFGCTVLATDPVPRDDLAGLVTYVSREQLLCAADIVTLHTPLTDTTRHLIDAPALAAMKDDAILVNCARGAVVDTEALADALEAGQIGGAALDVVEGEGDFYFRDRRGALIANPPFARLRALPNVVLTPHFAYLTSNVVAQMVTDGLDHAVDLIESGECAFEVHP